MSHPSNRLLHRLSADTAEPLDQQSIDTALRSVVHDLANDELQTLLLALLREWRERVTLASLRKGVPTHFNA